MKNFETNKDFNISDKAIKNTNELRNIKFRPINTLQEKSILAYHNNSLGLSISSNKYNFSMNKTFDKLSGYEVTKNYPINYLN